jgi:DNA-binding NtrC family response regulator
MILEDTSHIRPQSLPIAVRGAGSSFVAATGAAPQAFTGDAMSLVEQERRLLVQALEKTGGNQTQAARLLRITRDTLRYKMKKFNLR